MVVENPGSELPDMKGELPDMNYAYRRLLRYWVEPVVLRESFRARSAATPVTVILAFIGFIACLPFLVDLGVDFQHLAFWGVPLLLLLATRDILSRFILRRLDQFTTLDMLGADRLLRISSVLNQATMGMGIWILAPASDEHLVIAHFMTLLMVCWSVGVLANLFSDFPSFILSVPIMYGATASYWIWMDNYGISVGISLLLAMTLMILLVRRGSDIFRSSILMRFEKDQLLEEIKHQRQETLIALRDAQMANTSRQYFMAAAAHDIKQPLHALALLTDTLLLSQPPRAMVPLLERQRSSIDQMSDYFDALMDMRSFLKGDYELHLTEFSLSEFAARIELDIAHLCHGKGLSWRLEMDDVRVYTDFQLLLRMFRNLLTNAVRYTHEGAVCCKARAEGDVVEFLISDTGIGIAAEHQQVVFEEFVRLKTDGLDPSGSGLGLSIVKKISQALALNLHMFSTPGEGTRFTFSLPIVPEK